jgi:hypothetical protein
VAIEQLLHNACPSIQSRLRRELLGESRSSSEVAALQARILDDGVVRAVLAAQHPDGWIGWAFHGYEGMESGIRVLCEKDLDPRHASFSNALEALRRGGEERLQRGIGRPGRLLDTAGLGGAFTIRATLLAQAGMEEDPLVVEQVASALAAFRAVLDGGCLEDFLESYRGKPAYRAGVAWPGVYHLRLLAFTRGWRTPENREAIALAISRLVAWSPLPAAYLRRGSQLIAPASYAMHDFNPDISKLDDARWMMWFHRMELLARLGVVPFVPELGAQVTKLEEMLVQGGGMFTQRLAHDRFRKWGAYTGLMLEQDWRQASRREYDLTFRSLLILYHSSYWPAAFGF